MTMIPKNVFTPKTYAEAISQVRATEKQLTRDEAMLDEATQLLEDIKALMAKAVLAEEYSTAAHYKGCRDARQDVPKQLQSQVDQRTAELVYYKQIAMDLYIQEYDPSPERQVIVRKVTILDPNANESIDVMYFEFSDQVRVALAGEFFSGEAKHLSEWIAQHNFLSYVKEAFVNI